MSDLLAQLDRPSPQLLGDLGGDWDTALYEACQRFTQLDETAKRAIRAEIGRDRSWALVSWAEGMASLAVREANAERLLYGLVGLSLFSREEFDRRDAAIVFPLFVRAAELIGENADALTGAASELSDAAGGGWLLGLLPAGRHAMPPTHEEVGAGTTFVFLRRREDWDAEVELADFADEEAGK